jgi:hypothetical protein
MRHPDIRPPVALGRPPDILHRAAAIRRRDPHHRAPFPHRDILRPVARSRRPATASPQDPPATVFPAVAADLGAEAGVDSEVAAEAVIAKLRG